MSINPTARPKAGAPAANQFGVFQVQAVTGKQAAFIGRLVEQKDPATASDKLRSQVTLFRAGTLNKKHASEVIDALLALPDRVPTPGAVGAKLAGPAATEKQVGLIRSLLTQKDLSGTAFAAPAWTEGILGEHPVYALTRSEASAAITMLLSLPKADTKTAGATAKADVVTEDGMYRTPDGVIYKVQVAVHGNGRLYAKRLVVGAKGEKGTFEYAPGAINALRPEWKMTLAEAKEFGRLYGMCCNCGATLTDEVSIASGIGPVCAGRFA